MSHTFSRENSSLGTFESFTPIFEPESSTVLIGMTRREFQDLIYESPQAATVFLDFLIRMGLATRQSEYKNGGRRDVYLLTEVVKRGLGVSSGTP
jgi:hypothetical protein